MQVTRRRPRTPREASRRRDELDTLLNPMFFAALADPTRLRLVACIARCKRPCAVSEISACCAVDLSVVSRHLKVLADAGVLAATRDGRSVHYSLRSAEVAARMHAIADTLAASACEEGCCDGCC